MSRNTFVLAVLVAALAGDSALISGCAATRTRESSGEYVDDSAITTKVKAAFVKDDAVKARSINVQTFKGVVQLSGFVDTPYQKQRAGEIASGIAGVRSVENNLEVK
ncbi:MAG TPA: BON domain-containing protein [Candidatus Didemnitutus sp.]|nr:BON domain-containing protein [Candidatus Didemnitutus sp.]